MPAFEWTDLDRTRYQEIYNTMRQHLDKKTTRLLGAAMAQSLGRGGQTVIHELTGLSFDTLQLGLAQLMGTTTLDTDRVRRRGGGRKPITEIYPDIEAELLALVEDNTQGDPESPLLWTTKSLAHLAEVLTEKGMPVSTMTVSKLLAKHRYSLQANRKRFEAGDDHPEQVGNHRLNRNDHVGLSVNQSLFTQIYRYGTNGPGVDPLICRTSRRTVDSLPVKPYSSTRRW